MTDISDDNWSEKDERNAEVAPYGFPPGLPASIEQIGRMMMGAIKRSWRRSNPFYLTSGSGDNYVITPDAPQATINIYEMIRFRADRANTTTAPTLKYGNANVRSIKQVTASGKVNVAVGDIVAGKDYAVWYDGTDFILLNTVSAIGALLAANNLSDLANVPTARTNLGLGSAATQNTSAFATAAQGAKADGALLAANNLSDLANIPTARSTLVVDKKTAYSSKSADYTAVADDNNGSILFSASATLSLTAAATLGSGWHIWITASGGDVTIDPNGSEQINGASVLRVPDGSYAAVICTGTAFYATVIPSTIYGACRLTLSGGNLLLSRFNGNRLTINGVAENIPSAGVQLSPSGLTPTTLYYIYAYMNSGTMTLEASTTTHATDATTGVEIKSGDPTRSLVGMARPVTGPLWADSAAQRFVASYYNRKKSVSAAAVTANRTVSATSYTEFNSEIRNEFVCWNTDSVTLSLVGSCQGSSAVSTQSVAVAVDSGSTPLKSVQISSNIQIPVSVSVSSSLSEGYHYATSIGKASSGSITIVFADSDNATRLESIIYN